MNVFTLKLTTNELVELRENYPEITKTLGVVSETTVLDAAALAAYYDAVSEEP